MKKSNPTWLISRTLCIIWQRKIVNVVAGKPHMYALLIPGVALYGFFSWHIRKLLEPLSELSALSSDEKSFTTLIAGVVFGITIVTGWFLARQTITFDIPSALRALPLSLQSWMRAQLGIFLIVLWVCMSSLLLPLNVELGKMYQVNLLQWLLFVETMLVLCLFLGLFLLTITEKVIRLFPSALSSIAPGLHTLGQIAILVYVVYGRTMGSGIISEYNFGMETEFFIDKALGEGWAVALFIMLLLVSSMVIVLIIDSLLSGLRNQISAHTRSHDLLSYVLPKPRSRLHSVVSAVWRVLLTDKQISLPNLLIVLSVLCAAVGVRAGLFSEAVGLILYSVYNIVFLLLFSGWALSFRGRLGSSRKIIYGLPSTSNHLIIITGMLVIASVVCLYALISAALFGILGNEVGESWVNIGKNSLMLMAITSLTFALGVVSNAGQKNAFSQLPAAVAYTVSNVLGLVFLAWIASKYHAWGLVLAVVGIIMVSLAISVRYEEGHILDEA